MISKIRFNFAIYTHTHICNILTDYVGSNFYESRDHVETLEVLEWVSREIKRKRDKERKIQTERERDRETRREGIG